MQVGLKSNLSLTEEGKQQAEKLSIFFLKNNIVLSKMYCGYLQRQVQTAEVIARHLNPQIRIQKESAFDEIDYGLWEGLSQQQIVKKWPQEYIDWQVSAIWPNNIFNGTEDLHLNQLRRWVDNLREIKDGNVFVITSQGIIRYLLLILIPSIYLEARKDKGMNLYKVATGNYCQFVVDDKKNNLIDWNIKPAFLN